MKNDVGSGGDDAKGPIPDEKPFGRERGEEEGMTPTGGLSLAGLWEQEGI